MDNLDDVVKRMDVEGLRLLLLNICIFRLGGQVTVTAEDIEYVCNTVDKSQILLVKRTDKEEVQFLLKTILLDKK